MNMKPNETEDSVKLKPLFGIKPGVYLTVFYSIALIIILFFVFVYHGLVNYGTVLLVKTEPAGAAVRVNGVYLGAAGTKIPLPNTIKPGEPVNIQIVLPGFELEGGDYQIPGRVFGSRYFPHIFKLEYTLKTTDPAAVFANAASEYAAWTFGGEPTEAWQVPLVLSENAYRIGPYNDGQTADILKAASRFTVTRAALRDLTRAKILLDNGGQAPSPVALTGSLSDILVFLSENPGSAKWLADLLPHQSAAVVRESDWYKNEKIGIPVFVPGGVPAINNLVLAGLNFTGIQNSTMILMEEGTSIILNSKHDFTHIKGFMISQTPVPKALFETFLAENPEWREHYIDYFEGETTRHPAQIYDNNTVTGVSWFAAEAFCKWLTDKLPSSMSNMEVRLPMQIELESAENRGLIGRSEQSGWEWCIDPFAPLNFFAASQEAIQAAGSPEHTLYGRQAANSPFTRASLPPEFRSPIVSFRPVIAERE
jgi:hypothetical protein